MSASWRRNVRITVAGLLYRSGLLQTSSALRHRAGRANPVFVLGLHRVLTPEQESRAHSLPGIILRQKTFAGLLGFIYQNFRVISLAEFLAGDFEPSEGRPACLITFDDGWRDNYTTAFPLLRQWGLSATIFLATGFLGSGKTFWPEQLIRAWSDPLRRERICERMKGSVRLANGGVEPVVEHLKHMPAARREEILRGILSGLEGLPANGDAMMTWEEAAEMTRHGISFGSHTVTHPLLTFEDRATVVRELTLSKQQIEEKLGQPVRAFAYPNGAWDARVRELVAEAGFECAFTVQSGPHHSGADRLAIRRFLLHEKCVVGRDGQFSPAVTQFRLAWGR